MKTLKITIAAIMIAASLSITVVAQEKQKTTTVTKNPNTKEHMCNKGCTSTKHNYMHGEKGHVCTAECKKTMKKTS